MGFKHCSRMRRILGIPEDAYDNIRDDLYEDRPPLNPSQQALVDVVKAYQDAADKVNRDHGKVLIKNEVVELCPMTMPEGLLLYLGWPPKDD